MARGGPIVTIGGALLFLWWAISGMRPASQLFGEDAPEGVAMSILQRLVWALLGVALILYECLKFYRWSALSRG
jgi:hypothetical protein